MDRAFIEKHQVVERYLAGKLPFKAVQDFERFCRENPELLDELELPERLNAGLRLLEASGRPPAPPGPEEPEAPRVQWWRRVEVTAGLAVLGVVTLVCLWVLGIKYAERGDRIAALELQVEHGALQAPTRRRTITLTPSRVPTSAIGLALQLRETSELIELVLNVSSPRLNLYRLTLEKKGVARVGTIHNVLRDSNGNLRVIFNSSVLRPGDYKVTIEGLPGRGSPVPVGWFNVRVVK
jgi:hypothetical protein